MKYTLKCIVIAFLVGLTENAFSNPEKDRKIKTESHVFFDECSYIQIIEMSDIKNNRVKSVMVKERGRKVDNLFVQHNEQKLLALKRKDKNIKGLLVYQKKSEREFVLYCEAFGQDQVTRAQRIDIADLKSMAK